MRSVAAVSMLLGSVLAADNLIRVENGKVVEYGFATDLMLGPQMRSEGSGTGNVFTGSIGITDALDPNSPLSQFLDELLNPDSDPYKQAVVDAMKILLTILLLALGGLGVDTFTILVLGFSPGPSGRSTGTGIPVVVNYQVETITPLVAADIEAAINSNIGAISDYTVDPALTSIAESDTPVTTADCADCWVLSGASTCIPDPTKLTLECNPDGMELTLDSCIMGMTTVDLLTLGSAACDANSGEITEDGANFVIKTPLDGCSTSMEFKPDTIEFSNLVQGNFDSSATGNDAIINTYDRYAVSFTCDYATTYDNIGTTTNVTSSLMSGPVGDVQGSLDFNLETYTDSNFDTLDTSNTVRVGTTLYFTIEISNPIADVEYSVTDCTVTNAAGNLSYDIMTARCPNNRVNFVSINNRDNAQTQYSYTVFEFKNDDASTLHLSCNIVVCDANDALSTCSQTATCGRRRRRSFDEGAKYYRVAKNMVTV